MLRGSISLPPWCSMTSEVITPTIAKTDLSSGVATEVSFTGAKHFSIQCRTAVDVQVAKTAAAFAAGNYFTLKAGQVFNSPEKLSFTGSLWFKAASTVVLEVIEWDAT